MSKTYITNPPPVTGHKLYLAIILALVLVIVYLRACAPPSVVTETVTHTVVERDTVTVVDTVYVEVIPPEELQERGGAGQTDVEEDEDIRLIRSSYSDSMIVIMANLRMDLLTGQVIDTDFRYTLKQRIVRDRQLQMNVTTTTTTQITRTQAPGMYFSAGGLAGPGEITPFVSLTLSNRTMLLGGYDVQGQQWKVGASVPLGGLSVRSLF